MVLLKLYKETGNRKKKEVILADSIGDAMDAGQKSGLYYEVVDLASGRVIDWNEVNIRPEEDWYYDDSEMIWKKRSSQGVKELTGFAFREWLPGRKEEAGTFTLSY